MPLTGKAKTDYQREYMRKRRSKPVRPEPEIAIGLTPVIPEQPVLVRPEEVLEATVPMDMDEKRPIPYRVVGPLTKERQISRKGFNG